MKSLRRIIVVLLVLVISACSLSPTLMRDTKPAETQVPVTFSQVDAPKPTQDVAKYVCVTSVGLWLRKSPKGTDDSNKVFAVPAGTRMRLIWRGEWTHVYSEEYGYVYVNSRYIGDCK